ncbi:hypothetical protein GLOIN_2v1814043 [Rhizophagus clarus]|uniref:Endonuclease/exonuclease/phosphatase domain-containing protein n=1 Tax=Rhizophagus clarus TaxID=94130 RepID=A0A8H3R4K3_9GLOM|nr:hypothetical protein GLOIN_2v1814043 [Rhizophagus clarus]
MEIVVMGDFNQQYEKYNNRKLSNKITTRKHKIFKKLEELNMRDIQKEFNNNDKIQPTFIGNNNRKSRIDYIWTTENIYLETIKFINKKQQYINTDHNMLQFKFNGEGICDNYLPPLPSVVKKKEVFLYDELSDESKEELRNELSFKQIKSDYDLKFMNLEEKWNFYKQELIKAKQKHITKKQLNYKKII